MQEHYFQQLARNLADKYTKIELAKLLTKNKDRRISNLLASSFNKACMPRQDIRVVVEFDYYDYVARTLGPETWLYQFVNKEPWEKFKKALDDCPDERSKDNYLVSTYTFWKNEKAKEKESLTRYFTFLDRKREEQLAELKAEKKAELEATKKALFR